MPLLRCLTWQLVFCSLIFKAEYISGRAGQLIEKWIDFTCRKPLPLPRWSPITSLGHGLVSSASLANCHPILISTVCAYSYESHNFTISSICKIVAGIQFHTKPHDPGFLSPSPSIQFLLKGITKSALKAPDNYPPITLDVMYILSSLGSSTTTSVSC